MKELKTLKDLHWRSPGIKDRIELGILPQEYKCVDDWFVNSGKLKQEAIKWVKKYERAGWLRSAEDFKRFFNLTEEDLKGEKKE
jgi:hypothetical protein